jgi:hypothetical protein
MAKARETYNGQYLTTTEAARYAGVSVRTLCKWVDAGMIDDCFQIPDSKHRRISVSGLLKLLRANGMPIPKGLQ